MLTRKDARLIAEELHKLISNDVKTMVTKIVLNEAEEYLSAKEAAELLGWKLKTLYNRVSEVPHTKNGKILRFKKSSLIQYIERK